jgi:hypothetical protein
MWKFFNKQPKNKRANTTQRKSFQFEILERREVLTAAIGLSLNSVSPYAFDPFSSTNSSSTTFNAKTGELVVTGTNASDVIRIETTSGGSALSQQLQVKVNGVVQMTLPAYTSRMTSQNQQLYMSSVKLLTVDARNGDDQVQNATGIPARIYGGAGNDTLTGGYGEDTLYGGVGDDTLNGGSGNDRLFGDDGNDLLYGGDGNDAVAGGTGGDQEYGGSGNDQLGAYWIGSNWMDDAGSDSIYGDAGDDVLGGGFGDDYLIGGDGADELWGDGGNDELLGKSGNDRLVGGDGNDRLSGDDGKDNLSGDAGDDRLFGGIGNDIIYGGIGFDSLSGDNGDDKLFGNDGNDYLYGGYGDDQLWGNAGSDQLFGDEGMDFLDAGSSWEPVNVGINSGNDNADFNAYVTVVNGTTYTDIKQGSGPTCWVVAPLAEAAAKGVDLGSRIAYLGNGDYRISWLRSDGHNQGFEIVKFTGDLLSTDAQPMNRGEMWTILNQRAILQQANRPWNNPGSGGTFTETSLYVGRDSKYIATNDLTTIQSALKGNLCLTANCPKGNVEAARLGLPDWHWYAVLGTHTESISGQITTMVDLYNPHGNSLTISWDSFTKMFSGVVAT